MKRVLFAALLALVLAACAPFQPSGGEPEGVTLTHTDGVFELTADPPVLRAFLRVPGENLTVDHEDCDVVEGAVECTFGATESETVEVGGAPRLTDADGEPLDVAVVCRDECFALSPE